jgi:hypothetical protein
MEVEIDNAAFRALLESEVPMLGNYFIGFALPSVENERLDALPGGSGTLVSIDGVDGILTAKHVFHLLEKSNIVGMILASGFHADIHNPTFKIEHCARFLLPTAGEPPPSGPDLAFSDSSARHSEYTASEEVLLQSLQIPG